MGLRPRPPGRRAVGEHLERDPVGEDTHRVGRTGVGARNGLHALDRVVALVDAHDFPRRCDDTRRAARAALRTVGPMNSENSPDTPLVVDVTDADFQSAVVERSRETPVLVDLWASWCGPCRTLGPILEKVVTEQGGRLVLAKVDVDANPATAHAFQVQSIPAVYAMLNGEVLDGFIGSRSESAVREFVTAVLRAG